MQFGEHFFSKDYLAAKKRFCETATQRGWALESHFRGHFQQLELSTDLARWGPSNAPQQLVLSSGLHGVEGFLGSAIQLHFMEILEARQIRPDVSITLVHASNPYGFAHLRRFDEQNVDANRNFLLPEETYQGSHRYYRQMDSLLNPREWPKRELPVFLQALLKIIPYGFHNLQQAIAEGQYDFPQGLFFGGHGPSSTMQFWDCVLLPKFQPAENLMVLDVHSGLGKWGTSKMLLDYALNKHELQRLGSLFGNKLSPNQVHEHYQARGSLYCWLRSRLPSALAFCWEFGTYKPIRMLAALRAENAATHWGEPNSKSFHQARRGSQEAFCPASRAWRRMVLKDARAILQTLAEKWLTP